MRVLLCNTTDTGGGAAIAANRLLNGLNSIGVDAKMLVLNKSLDNPDILRVEDYLNKSLVFRLKNFLKRKVSFYYKTYRWRQYPERMNISLDDIFISYIEDCLTRIEFDILHLHWVEGGFINFKELQRIKKPIIWTIHGSFPFTGICHHLICDKYITHCEKCPALGSYKKRDLSSENFNLKLKRYKLLDLHIVSPSKFMAEKAIQSKLLGNRPVITIPNAIDTQVFVPLDKKEVRHKLNIENKKTILFGAVGATTDQNKGFKLLLNGLEELQKSYEKEELQILIFGGGFNGSAFFNTIKFGNISDEYTMSLLYSAADVMVVPSKHENLPYTVMESLACGTPVTAFSVGGIPEMIVHKGNGYLARPFEPADLAEGIKFCLENNSNNQLGKQARQCVIEKYSIKDISQRYLNLYHKVLQ